MALDGQPVPHAEAMDPNRERPLRRDRGVLLAERSRGRVPRVRGRLLALRDQSLVQLLEAAERQIDLAAHLEERRRDLTVSELHPHRDRLDRPQVRRDILASYAVAARRAAYEDTVLVDQVDREPVDFRLRHVRDVARAKPFADILVPLLERLVRRHFVERPHPRRVLDLLELLGRRRAHSLRRRLGRHQLRVRFLQRHELVVEAVVFGVRDLRIVEDVVAVEVVREQVTELGHPLLDRRGLRGHRVAPPPCRRRRRVLRLRAARVDECRPT
jgi:hypothetical protein